MNDPKTNDHVLNEWMRELLLLPEQASTLATEIDRLHYFVISITMLGATLVGLVAFIFILRYRKRDDRQTGEHFELGLKRETVLIGLLVGLFFWWWWIGIRQYVRIQVPPKDTTDIYVVAKQWVFKFSYPAGNSSVSDLYVPAGRPVRLIMTSRDVIHDFYVPEFRVKQDIVPGRYTTLWFEVPEPGEYEILCAEFCGTNHSTMRGRVIALPPSEYAAWLESGLERDDSMVAQPALARQPEQGFELVDVGVEVASAQGCLRCHTTDGTPHIGPSFAGLYGARVQLESGEVVIADEAYLTQSMMDPLADLHHGYQPVMPSYKGLLHPAETAALLELMKSLRDAPQREYPPAQAEGLPLYPEPKPEPKPSPNTKQETTP
jgi:cytochrome c oxidase subunit 2